MTTHRALHFVDEVIRRLDFHGTLHHIPQPNLVRMADKSMSELLARDVITSFNTWWPRPDWLYIDYTTKSPTGSFATQWQFQYIADQMVAVGKTLKKDSADDAYDRAMRGI